MFQTNVAEKIEKHILYSVNFFPENRAVFKLMWKDTVQTDRPQITIWRMRITCWTTKATNTHSEYVILIAFPLQQLVHERASTLRYTLLLLVIRARSQGSGCTAAISLIVHPVF
jgi:hypothetical protein